MFKHNPRFPRNPVAPREVPGHLNLRFLLTDDHGDYVVPSLKWFEKNVRGASEAELDKFYEILRAWRRRRLWKTILGLIVLALFVSVWSYLVRIQKYEELHRLEIHRRHF